MPTVEPRGTLDFRGVQEALAASSVGTWDWDIVKDRTKVCPATARLFGFTPADVERGPRLADYTEAIHPADRLGFNQTVANVRKRGGLFVAEYRTVVDGEVRWVLARGEFTRNASGNVTRARGIVIDVTDSRQDGFTAGRALFSSADEPASILDRFADSVLEAWRIMAELDQDHRDALRPIMELLLVAVGQELAKVTPIAAAQAGAKPLLHS